ncbi:MAG: hypothetical protein K8H74_16125 [Notoacmeibacter sp.]|nr:hypothetical protein [Notoacmeibacter sp.]
MTTRTTQTVVRFSNAFQLPGVDEPQPSGDYRVDRDEELIEGVSRLVWRHVGAFIHLPAIDIQSPMQRMVPISLGEIEATLQKEHTQS